MRDASAILVLSFYYRQLCLTNDFWDALRKTITSTFHHVVKYKSQLDPFNHFHHPNLSFVFKKIGETDPTLGDFNARGINFKHFALKVVERYKPATLRIC